MAGEPIWITVEDALLIHAEVIRAFGGSDGVRDLGLLESALARPRNVYAYEGADLFALAGAYGHGIAKNHPFVDGNKRSAFVVTRVFLGANGIDLRPSDIEAVVVVEGLASGEISQDEFITWLRRNSKPARRRKPPPKQRRRRP